MNRLKALPLLWRKLPTEAADLEKLAQDLGVSLFNTAVTKNDYTGTDTYEVQRRIREVLRSRLDAALWVIALVSALASLASALAAWWAVTS